MRVGETEDCRMEQSKKELQMERRVKKNLKEDKAERR